MSINQAFILAAGEGTRMRPLTLSTPKPLIKVNGKTMLDRILDKLNKIKSINKIVINGFYLSEKIKNHLTSLNDKRILFSEENIKLETGGGLIQALPLFNQNEPILIINGDIVWQDNAVLEKMIANFDADKMDILLGLKEKKSFLGYDGNGNFNLKNGEISTAKINDFVYVGIQIFHPRLLQNQDLPQAPFSLNYFFKDAKIKSIRLKGIALPGKFFHIGTMVDLEKYGPLIDQIKNNYD